MLLDASWKLPVAYFFLDGLTGSEHANLIRQFLVKLYEINVHVTALISDGPACNISMYRELGANLDTHPTNK